MAAGATSFFCSTFTGVTGATGAACLIGAAGVDGTTCLIGAAGFTGAAYLIGVAGTVGANLFSAFTYYSTEKSWILATSFTFCPLFAWARAALFFCGAAG